MGYEFWPDALEACIRYAAERVSVLIYVTESGIATDDDTRRIAFMQRSLAGVLHAAWRRASTSAAIYTGRCSIISNGSTVTA